MTINNGYVTVTAQLYFSYCVMEFLTRSFKKMVMYLFSLFIFQPEGRKKIATIFQFLSHIFIGNKYGVKVRGEK